jgi:hypothetical protein
MNDYERIMNRIIICGLWVLLVIIVAGTIMGIVDFYQ